jgi:hypothetical protein
LFQLTIETGELKFAVYALLFAHQLIETAGETYPTQITSQGIQALSLHRETFTFAVGVPVVLYTIVIDFVVKE